MHFGFALELSDIDLWNTDLLDTHLDLLYRDRYTDIPSRYFVCLRKIFKRSSRPLQDMSSRHVFKTCFQDILKTCLQDVFSVTIFCLARRLQDQQMFAGLLLQPQVEKG